MRSSRCARETPRHAQRLCHAHPHPNPLRHPLSFAYPRARACAQGLESRHPAARLASALALRNLAYSADGQAAILGRRRALPALLRALHPSELPLASRAAHALWALIGHTERAKATLRAPPTLAELKAAERALTTTAMVSPPRGRTERAALDEALRALGAVMATLRL